MKLLTTANEIREQIKSLRPTHIAVAYIGSDWQEFVDHKSIEAIIIAPKLGSNPDAIGELAQKIGWNKVYFLDNLHVKLYINDKMIMIGSANLSRNALDINGLIEMCVILDDREILKEAKGVFDSYVQQATRLYRTEKDKQEKLKQLRKIHNRAIEHTIIEGTSKVRPFTEYDSNSHGDFYIGWYIDGTYDYKYDSLKPHFPNLTKKEIANAISAEIPFSPKESLETHKWILCWKITKRSKLVRASNFSWLYIHETYKDACTDKGYENLAVQLKNRGKPARPFSLRNDRIFKDAFNSVINNGEFEIFLDKQGREPWLYRRTLRKFPEFIKSIKEKYRELSAK